MKENIIQDKSFKFALQIINLYKNLIEIKKEYVLSKQVLRSGTSIGLNIEESIGGQSKNDFLAKISIAYKEARETMYWLKLLKESKYINEIEFNNLFNDLDEILKILGKIQITLRNP
ncbi:four helix bundle protein [Candidatus Shapirobacteria bacterium CG_4_8_14_3_um_filter_35_11]|uniref:Four helix bundle protein n=6 Tax=Candidatus Shapironibacteriota TaxID=1752721 RepID=A0A1J5HPG2_9BACT|nr:MAG: four helix bundle protein [Candidatus Shapirobacteria bacterium CG2_30_35_20]PIV07024.1 MAG: four helix bundle protein [Candidatus Shapirobacteria bacterium CG03_land_8_20_14_0_80_35_14]PIX67860.1 MAG: four helix bundle protein [Candidatus Shapirobacteria bacterium CG_4_10_14_3_um_filter_35_13]PJA51247.1 MAG: four helix bundle protein [Candidatus Shapirobacteria bacterium CG_4_9_14_3_um_filter_36_12]PJC79722.1 MAG: four helix bundle protein [Candidatus Shapirobacteria bacterium CG_4_8_1